MIKLINATKYYKTQAENKYILNRVNLEIPGGLNVGILGRNGQGKSTLLKMLAGIDFVDSGEIVSDSSFSWVMGLSKGLQQAMTGRQNVKFVCRIYGKGEEEIRKIATYVKEFSELEDYFDMPINLYSNGMKSRLAFALSLAFDFDYLIIDEILSVGDASFKQKSEQALKEKMQSCNILIVSHSMDTLRDLCDVGILVDKGNVTYFDHIEDAIQGYNNLNKVAKKKIHCSDGNIFETIQEIAKYYKVMPKSVQQALKFNNGTHVYLNKIFWYEDEETPMYQQWKNIVDKETIIVSDGNIFNNSKEAYYFYNEKHKKLQLSKTHIDDILQNNGFSKILKLQFYYLSEFKNEKS